MRTWTPSEARFTELFLYISRRCATSPKFGSVKLNKLLYYCDFLSFALLGKPITGFTYRKLEKGPAPAGIVEIRNHLLRSGQLKIREVLLPNRHRQLRPVALREADLRVFTKAEIEVVDRVIDILVDTNASRISDLSHLEIGWMAARLNETIPYGTVFLSNAALSAEETERIRTFAREHGYASGYLRDIVEEPLFAEQLEKLGVSFARRDEIMEAVSFSLARAPELFPRIEGTCLSALTVKFYDNMPSVRFLFTYNEDRVRLVAIDFG